MTSSKLHSPATFATFLSVVLITVIFGCVKRQKITALTLANDQHPAALRQTSNQAGKRININTASAAELEELPGIGQALAQRIIEHREKYGSFRRAEYLIIVRGISDRKFRALRDLISVE